MSALLQSLADGFEASPAARPEAVGPLPARREALRRALELGLPSPRSEAWKYTSLRALGARRFEPAAPAVDLDAALLAHIAGPRLVFVNGRFDARLSVAPGIQGVQAVSDGAWPADAGAVAAGGATAAPDSADHVFTLLNEALAADGARVDVAEGVDAGLLNLVFVSAPVSADLAVHLRHRLRLGRGARLRLVEHHLATGPHRHLANHRLELQVQDEAQLLHLRLQDEHEGASLVARSEVALATGAAYRRADLELGAGLSRHELSIVLAGPGARCAAGGVLFADGRRHLDTRLSVVHAARDTACELPWRGLANDRARLALLGAITILAGADGSDARLSAKNLLLSEGAEVDAQPVLEIHADEVKAAHGATVGRLDATSLFYLRSRGIPEGQARALLTQAFCREALAPLAADEALLGLASPRLESRLLAAQPS